MPRLTRPCLGTRRFEGDEAGLDCGALSTGPRCRACSRAWDRRRRPPARARGYDRDHERARAALRMTLPALCGYGCGRGLQPDGAWVAAHVVDGNPSAGWIAACYTCNERAKLRRA